jgi:hypothetical protein
MQIFEIIILNKTPVPIIFVSWTFFFQLFRCSGITNMYTHLHIYIMNIR